MPAEAITRLPELARGPDGAPGAGQGGRAANPGESRSRVILIQQGVPPTDLQVPVLDEDGLIGYADFGWVGVLGELDGKGKYGIGVDDDPEEAGRIVWREKKRADRFRDQGQFVRWTA